MIADKLNSKIKNRVKNKSKYFILILFLLFTYIGNAQISLSGKVITSENKPLELAEVVLLTKDSVAIKSELTDGNGYFNLKANPGKYKIQIRQIGKSLFYKEIEAVRNTDLGDIIVVLNENVLKEITVVARKKLIERKVDRLVFNVENSISAAGGDALDALKITPSIRVQNDKISLIGKSSLAVMIDDKLIQLSGDDLINFLKTISSDNIKNIEVITTPPAKYSAEGNSGLININLKKAKANSWNTSINSAYKQNTYSTGNIGGTLNYQKNKISLVVNSNYLNGAMKGIENRKIFFPTQLWESENTGKYYSNLFSNRLGIEYQLTKKLNTGVQFIGSFSKPNIDDLNNTYLTDKNTDKNIARIQTFGNSLRERISNSINWHTNLLLDTSGKNLSLDFDYLNYKSDNNRYFTSITTNSIQPEIPNSYISANNLTVQKIENYSAQINVAYPMKWARFNYGSKLSYSITNNNIDYFDTTTGITIFDPTKSNLFLYKEKTQAFYFSANKKLLKNKLEIQIGLRSENTQTEGNSITLNQTTKNNINKIFPTTYLSYNPNENNSISINYSKRITRPNFNSLNPFKWYTTPYTYSEGNPDLKPTYTHNLELNYSYKDYLSTSLFFTKEFDNSGQVVLLSDNDYKQIVTRLNYFDNYNIGLQQVYVLKKYTWLESQSSVSLYFQHSDSKIFPITPKSNEGLGASITSSNTFTLNKEKTILSSFEFQHNFANQSSDLVYNYPTTQLNLSLRLLFLKKSIQVNIIGNNILKALDYNNSSNRYNNLTINKGYYDTRYIRFSIAYKFGNSKVNISKRELGNEEEKNRIN